MTEIAFLTLFLGLTAGVQDVSLDVRGPAARVEIWLDAARVAEIAHPPWQARIDFGATLLPHRLEARVLDAQGAVVARRVQLLNLPRPPAEIELLLERDAAGHVVAARLVWQNLTNAPPQSIVAQVDDRPRSLGDGGRIDLLGLAPDTIHVLSAEVRFDGGAIARADAAFGGDLGEQAGGELTAVPLAGTSAGALRPDALRDAVLAGGAVRAVVGLDEGRGVLMVVREPSALGALCRGVDDSSYGGFSQGSPSAVSGGGPGEPRLAAGDTLRFLWPWKETASRGPMPFELFASSPEVDGSHGRLTALLCRADAASRPTEVRLADAVALAGLQATAGARRRAVLLILGSAQTDASQFTPAAVRDYLRALHVPLVVWRTATGKSASATDGWGPGVSADSPPAVRRALAEVLRRLDEQRIGWVDGSHLPGELTLAPAARAAGLRFADEVER